MAQLRLEKGQFDQREIQVIVVGPEDRETFGDYWHSHDMPFVGIPDPDHTLADLYGQQVKLLRLGRMPAQFLIDEQGRIIFTHLAANMADITPSETVFELVDAAAG